ncbi:MAG: hypothetical protein K2P78_04435 [Gemmataceae bacterium]|nr:hypothetical protein [Gemmataceae bacterium]
MRLFVSGATATLRLFEVWEPIVRLLGLPVARVAQDGLVPAAVPWDRLDAAFVGGSTDWKLGSATAAVVRDAKRRVKWVHLGRCNTRRRFRHAHRLGCDSVNGSGFSRWPDQWVPLALRWLHALHGDATAPPAAGGDFFRGGLGGSLFGGRGWAVERVEDTAAGNVVRARVSAEPGGCPRCGTAPGTGGRCWSSSPANGSGAGPAATRSPPGPTGSNRASA